MTLFQSGHEVEIPIPHEAQLGNHALFRNSTSFNEWSLYPKNVLNAKSRLVGIHAYLPKYHLLMSGVPIRKMY